jgi:hypothetical protein
VQTKETNSLFLSCLVIFRVRRRNRQTTLWRRVETRARVRQVHYPLVCQSCRQGQRLRQGEWVSQEIISEAHSGDIPAALKSLYRNPAGKFCFSFSFQEEICFRFLNSGWMLTICQNPLILHCSRLQLINSKWRESIIFMYAIVWWFVFGIAYFINVFRRAHFIRFRLPNEGKLHREELEEKKKFW